MGASRSDERSQRAYLGKLATNFEKIVDYALNAYYTQDEIFNDRLEMRLITRIIRLNEVFSEVFSQRGHTRYFEHHDDEDDKGSQPESQLPEIVFEIPTDRIPELEDIIRAERFQCPEPSDESIMEHIEKIFRESRGPELGTVSSTTYFVTVSDHMLMVCSLVAPYWALPSRSNPSAGRTLSCPTSVM